MNDDDRRVLKSLRSHKNSVQEEINTLLKEVEHINARIAERKKQVANMIRLEESVINK